MGIYNGSKIAVVDSEDITESFDNIKRDLALLVAEPARPWEVDFSLTFVPVLEPDISIKSFNVLV